LSIPLGRIGYLAPKTFSRVISENVSDASGLPGRGILPAIGRRLTSRKDEESCNAAVRGKVIPSNKSNVPSGANSRAQSRAHSPSRAEVGSSADDAQLSDLPPSSSNLGANDAAPKPPGERVIRFPDEQHETV
jgi:hypothetical protein